MGTFEVFEHTADVGLEIEAGCLEDLLETASRAVFSVVLVDEPGTAAVETEVRVRTPPGLESHEDLLVAWLQELLYKFETESLVPLTFVFHERGPTALRARVGFGVFDPEAHRVGTEVKAVTYHDLEVRHEGGRWTARLILDI